MLKKFFNSFLIIFLFNTVYIPYIPPKEIFRRKKIEYIFDKDDDFKDFIFLKEGKIFVILSMKIKKSILSKN
jgi:hypothetical protein